MARIILKVESQKQGKRHVILESRTTVENRHDALGRSACVLADQMRAAAIVAVTNSGQTARVLARYRPDPPRAPPSPRAQGRSAHSELSGGCAGSSSRTWGKIRTAHWRKCRKAWWERDS